MTGGIVAAIVLAVKASDDDDKNNALVRPQLNRGSGTGLQGAPARANVVQTGSSATRHADHLRALDPALVKSIDARIARGELSHAYSSRAFSDPGTDYSLSNQLIWTNVGFGASDPLEEINTLLCILRQLKINSFANQGEYVALVDESRCVTSAPDPTAGGGAGGIGGGGGGGGAGASPGGGSGAAAQTVKVARVVTEVARFDDDTPQLAIVWYPDGNNTVRLFLETEAEPTAADPFGKFALSYQYDGDSFGTPISVFSSIRSLPVASGVSYETSTITYQSSFSFVDAVVTTYDPSTGQGRSDYAYDGLLSHSVLYSNTHMLEFYNDPFGGSSPLEFCYDLSNPRESIYTYGLFNASDGAAITLNSDLYFSYGPVDEFGFQPNWGSVGYYGLYFDGIYDGTPWDSNTEVSVVTDWSTFPPTEVKYTIDVRAGAMDKYTVSRTPLTSLGSTRLLFWNSSFVGGTEYVGMIYKTTPSAGFYAVKRERFLDSATEWAFITLAAPEPVPASFFQTGTEYTFSTGGSDGIYVGGDSEVSLTVRTRMQSSDAIGSSTLAAGSTVPLFCFSYCIKPTVSQADIDAYSYNLPLISGSDTLYKYQYDPSTGQLQYIDPSTGPQVVRLADGVTPQWGLWSGNMLLTDPGSYTAAVAVVKQAGTQYFQYILGSPYDTTPIVRDSANNPVTFDAPLVFDYTHTTANDRVSDASFNGEVTTLYYAGGYLSGIPYVQNDDAEYWYYGDAYALKDGTPLSANGNDYVVKALEGFIEFPPLATSACTTAGLTASQPTVSPPASYNGAPIFPHTDVPIPDIKTAPVVIYGELANTTASR